MPAGGVPEGPPSIRVRVTDLRRHAGSREEVSREVDLRGLGVGGTEVADAPVSLNLVLEALSGGVRAQGALELAWVGECRRCLGPASGEVVAEISELFEDVASSEDSLPIQDGWIDLGGAVRDVALLALPLAPLCSPDCAGPAPGVFPVAIEGEQDTSGGHDPRWAVLSELHLDPEEEG